MHNRILRFLKEHGEKLDAQIARALNMSMSEVRNQMSQLSHSHDIVCCKVTRFVEGNKIEGLSCRISCDEPSATRGRKPGGSVIACPLNLD